MFNWQHAVLMCLIIIPFSSASAFLPSSGLKQSAILKGETYSAHENLNLLIEDRLDILENVINQLRKENENQHEGINQLKIQNENQYKEILQLKNEISHQKEDIVQLKNESQNQKEETQDIKSFMDRLILDCTTFHLTESNHTKIDTSTRQNGIRSRVKRQAAIGDTSSASWAKLEISDHVIGYMDYDTYTVKIYDHASNNKDINMKNEEKKYYFEPIGQLDHQSAKSSFNNISEKAEMYFNVNMWSDSIRNAVHKFISDDLKRGPVNINLVRVLPMDRVMLFNEIGSSQQHFELEQNWINYKSDKYLKFKFTCNQLKRCNDLALQMKTNPEQFNFNMKFSLSSQKSNTKETKINIETIMNGEMINKLEQKFPEKDVILLTANGKKRLLKESSENVFIQTIDDSQFPTKNSQNEINRRLENMIRFGRTTIKKGDEKAWKDNVFWNRDNYRPDVSSRIVNDIYNKLDTENQKKFASEFKNSFKGAFETSGSIFGILSGNAKVTAELSMEGMDTKESVDKFLNEATERVEWDGVKFVPKQMELYAINMARLKNSQAFKDTDIKISYTTSMLTIDVRHDSSFDQKTSSELFELKNKVAELEHFKRKGRSSRIPPSSCQDLSESGHYLDGLYAIKNKDTKKVQAVHCQFEPSSVVQEFVGNIDVKTKTVHFYVERDFRFGPNGDVIPFYVAPVNEGNGFNLTSGIFTVPVPGIYHFDFSAVRCKEDSYFTINLLVDGSHVGSPFTDHKSATDGCDVVFLSTSLRLAAGNKVKLHKVSRIRDNRTHFSGWLVEERLM